MWKRYEKGFTLLETLIALVVITVCSSFLIPIYMHTLQERQAIVQEEEALSVLNNALNHWISDPSKHPSIVKQSGMSFHLNWDIRGDDGKVCVMWQSQIKRGRELCGEGIH
ncbi:prepilin-type N-terminal cleavage/methylation domain-containing protein [Pullulanibacillus pueri]|uniref:Prepilin-type N-terminal cleavage/methylation domain-containing protein n=1 Tax=Pullulanibacillus pueri TaxID=1437324 RepID=A0A8J3ELS2_9BACL|nr:competence type IV pilus minor pilin ComGE [Pullulanibacillus pueri]MBM7681554.1 prepilin-type N-terminal cleavage/methylation domain-containing protein [Pullulanibacillus pueri]GGH79694.1 hypothetical protein GCM10007096_15000 [Pullulanibacillus pueri]